MPDQDKAQRDNPQGKVNIEKPGTPRIDPSERGKPATSEGGGRPMDKDRNRQDTSERGQGSGAGRQADADRDRASPSRQDDAERQAGGKQAGFPATGQSDERSSGETQNPDEKPM